MARPGLTGHRKFRRLVRSLGSTITARGVLELIWESCYESGDEYVGTAEDIETLVGWMGERGMLTHALVEAGSPEGQGFIEPVSEAVDGRVAYQVHDLWHHAPEYVAKRRKRELERRQKTTPVASDRRTAPNGGQWTPSPDWQIEVGRTPSPSHSPSPNRKNVSSEASVARSEPTTRGPLEARVKTKTQEPVEVRELPSFLVFPVIGPGDKQWSLSEAQVAEWVTLFPGLDVRGESRKALAWVLASLGRKKTARGMARFLVGWLGRTNDRGGGRTKTEAAYVAAEWVCPHVPPCGQTAFRCHQAIQLAEAKANRTGAA